MIGSRLPPLTPDIQPTFPVLLRDGGPGNHLQATDLTRILLQPTIDALPVIADGDIPQPDS